MNNIIQYELLKYGLYVPLDRLDVIKLNEHFNIVNYYVKGRWHSLSIRYYFSVDPTFKKYYYEKMLRSFSEIILILEKEV